MLQKAPLRQAHPKTVVGRDRRGDWPCGISLAPLDAAARRDLPAPLNVLDREASRFSSVGAYLDALTAQPPFEVGRGADAALVISHHKLSGQANHGRAPNPRID